MNKEETGLSPEAKLEKMFESWLKPQGINFISPEAERAYRGRATRIKDIKLNNIYATMRDCCSKFWLEFINTYPYTKQSTTIHNTDISI